MDKICVIGCGFVGLTFGVHAASKGYEVLGVEKRSEVVEKLNSGQPHFFELGLEGLLKNLYPQKIRFTSKISAGHNIYVITVGTPFIGNTIDTSNIFKVIDELNAECLTEDSLVILRSTVGIGITRQVFERVKDSGAMVAFCPERTIEGKALDELENLPQIVSGCCPRALEHAFQFFSTITKVVIKVSSTQSAEMVKLLNNSQRDTYFALANEVAMLCDAFRLDAYEVINAATTGYGRSSIFKPGLVGGPCLEKDPHILAESAQKTGSSAALIKAGRMVNESVVPHAVSKLRMHLQIGSVERVLVCGAAFKGHPATDDLRGSLVFPLIAQLRELLGPGAEITVWDAEVAEHDLTQAGLQSAGDLFAEIDGADLVVIQNNHRFFSNDAFKAALEKRDPVVYDFWHNLPNEMKLTKYMGLGFGNV